MKSSSLSLMTGDEGWIDFLKIFLSDESLNFSIFSFS